MAKTEFVYKALSNTTQRHADVTYSLNDRLVCEGDALDTLLLTLLQDIIRRRTRPFHH